ncbi:YesL family protein [Vagococcus fluvialis]|uniref:DUF624 domain-containing protein n=1 Tax=Vagococcus fluvialis TaxID=2738 RepID=A0A7X6I3E9_9ENTE|nr:DUF624 domain-containing protein [Vagococcus fluvialis]NKC68110.1 DUF624 domain-containing protein [Vagococcus fluvialis]
MKDLRGIIKLSYVIGQILIQGVMYQLYFLLYALRGVIVLGVFPSLAAVFQSLYNQLRHGENVKRENFEEYYKGYFKIANQLGYTYLAILGFLWFDLRVSGTFIHSTVLHFILLVFFVFALGTSLYVFPSLCRYELTYKQYLQRSVILFLSNLVGTLAMLVGVFAGTFLVTLFPILLFVATVPIYVLPLIWFGMQGMERAESKVEEK